MKKTLKQILILAFLVAILVFPYFVFASNPAMPILEATGELSGFQEAKETTVSTIAGTVVATAFSILGIIFIIFILYGGYLWMTDQGNEEQVTKAKKIIRNSIIGLIIIISAWAISELFTSLFVKTLN